MGETVGGALRSGMARLRAAGVENPGLDARLLLAHATGRDQAALLREPGAAVDGAAYGALLERRVAREPLALIVGRQGFWSLDLEVSGATLVPRGDSETLIEAAIEAALEAGAGRTVRLVLDLGTGTGCLLLAALVEFPGAWGLGVDRVGAAVALARRNAVAVGLGGRASFVCGDWGGALAGGFDLVLCNPPYVRTGEMAGLMPEVGRYEPAGALDGGVDGLEGYRAVLAVLPRLLAPGGVGVMELGAGQAGAVGALAGAAGFGHRVRRDLAGVERALVLEKGVVPGGGGD